MNERLFLSRRNLQTLLHKLDRVRAGSHSLCSIIKNDKLHPVYPATIGPVLITAVEDEVYYTDREPGMVLDIDTPKFAPPAGDTTSEA